MDIDAVMRLAPVIPVIVANEADDACQIAEALASGGLRVIEVMLRTPQALDAIHAMSSVEGVVVGAGTVLYESQLDAALEAGAQFVVAPGLTEHLARSARSRGIAFLPGVATASDIMRGLDLGISRFKFFPAEASGGVKALEALSGPFSEARFCPTGGISMENARDYLALESVLCVGGSWLVPAGGWDLASITAAAREAASLVA